MPSLPERDSPAQLLQKLKDATVKDHLDPVQEVAAAQEKVLTVEEESFLSRRKRLGPGIGDQHAFGTDHIPSPEDMVRKDRER